MQGHFLQLIGFTMSEKIMVENNIRRSTNVLQLGPLIGHRLTSLHHTGSMFVRVSLRCWRLLQLTTSIAHCYELILHEAFGSWRMKLTLMLPTNLTLERQWCANCIVNLLKSSSSSSSSSSLFGQTIRQHATSLSIMSRTTRLNKALTAAPQWVQYDDW